MSLETGVQERFAREILAPPFADVDNGFIPDNVHLTFYFTPHLSAEHFDEGAKLLAQSDVLIPELVCWNDKSIRQYKAVSKGDLNVLKQLTNTHTTSEFGDYSSAVLRGLYNTRKPVGFIDADHTRRDLLIGDFAPTYGKAVTGDVETTLDGLADVAAIVAGKSLTRDTIMVSRLGPVLDDLVTKHPRLSARERVGVLVSLGVNHRQVYEHLECSPGLRGRVAAHQWAGKLALHAEGVLVDKYKRGQAPTYVEVTEFLVKAALNMIRMPNIYDRPFYDIDSVYKREKDQDVVGEEIARMVMEIGSEGLELCRKTLRRISPSLDEAKILKDICIKAIKLTRKSS